ncbi:MAG TPA: cytochrome C oxidase subunit II [Candidatus Latescibacteria bacterium]|jgi:cytochrome c oxidase subunit 2|nr:cytochrome C oxidase subunit II [Chloroflexota bacterium]HJN27210.1 cytochrome C oxidase subunit II [Candidatus Latescibacterota bacterium]|tara:strand:- start:441 stop:1142 length:702 start_codon:yes stop_codon:yes gene_type:complete
MIESLIPAVSSYAREIDHLITEVAIIVGVWLVAAEALFFYFIIKYRAREGHRADYISGDEPRMRRWLVGPVLLVLVCDLFLIVGALKTWSHIKIDLPPADVVVKVIAQQWAWTFILPGADGKLDTADDIVTVDELHVEVGKTYHFQLESRDVVHCFSVPVFRLKQDAIPGRTITGWFRAISTGTYDIQCAEICGIGHGVMAARIVIDSAPQHAAWINGSSIRNMPTAMLQAGQ